MFRDKTAVRKDTPIKGVRMGAGERSYLVRDNQIDVLKNMYGGVQVLSVAIAPYHQQRCPVDAVSQVPLQCLGIV